MVKAKVKQTEYAIMVEPLLDADGGGWLATFPALPGWDSGIPATVAIAA